MSQLQEPYSSVGYLCERTPFLSVLKLKHPSLQDSDPHLGNQGSEELSWTAWDVCEGKPQLCLKAFDPCLKSSHFSNPHDTAVLSSVSDNEPNFFSIKIKKSFPVTSKSSLKLLIFCQVKLQVIKTVTFINSTDYTHVVVLMIITVGQCARLWTHDIKMLFNGVDCKMGEKREKN